MIQPTARAAMRVRIRIAQVAEPPSSTTALRRRGAIPFAACHSQPFARRDAAATRRCAILPHPPLPVRPDRCRPCPPRRRPNPWRPPRQRLIPLFPPPAGARTLAPRAWAGGRCPPPSPPRPALPSYLTGGGRCSHAWAATVPHWWRWQLSLRPPLPPPPPAPFHGQAAASRHCLSRRGGGQRGWCPRRACTEVGGNSRWWVAPACSPRRGRLRLCVSLSFFLFFSTPTAARPHPLADGDAATAATFKPPARRRRP